MRISRNNSEPTGHRSVNPDDAPGGREAVVSRRTRLFIVAAVAILLVGGAGVVSWALLHRGDTSAGAPGSSAASAADRQDARAAAAVAADLPARRADVLDPLLDDNPEAVPVYPAGTTITLDQASWVRAGESASAYAQVMPQNQRVLIDFTRVNGRWYIAQIETQP